MPSVNFENLVCSCSLPSDVRKSLVRTSMSQLTLQLDPIDTIGCSDVAARKFQTHWPVPYPAPLGAILGELDETL
jgi:hypothetical protein